MKFFWTFLNTIGKGEARKGNEYFLQNSKGEMVSLLYNFVVCVMNLFARCLYAFVHLAGIAGCVYKIVVKSGRRVSKYLSSKFKLESHWSLEYFVFAVETETYTSMA